MDGGRPLALRDVRAAHRRRAAPGGAARRDGSGAGALTVRPAVTGGPAVAEARLDLAVAALRSGRPADALAQLVALRDGAREVRPPVDPTPAVMELMDVLGGELLRVWNHVAAAGRSHRFHDTLQAERELGRAHDRLYHLLDVWPPLWLVGPDPAEPPFPGPAPRAPSDPAPSRPRLIHRAVSGGGATTARRLAWLRARLEDGSLTPYAIAAALRLDLHHVQVLASGRVTLSRNAWRTLRRMVGAAADPLPARQGTPGDR